MHQGDSFKQEWKAISTSSSTPSLEKETGSPFESLSPLVNHEGDVVSAQEQQAMGGSGMCCMVEASWMPEKS
jgi:hypothetical protein